MGDKIQKENLVEKDSFFDQKHKDKEFEYKRFIKPLRL